MHCVPEGAYARKNGSLCGEDIIFILCYYCLTANEIQRLYNALKISCSIVDNCYH